MTDEAMANPVLRELHNKLKSFEHAVHQAERDAEKARAAHDAALQMYFAAEQAFEKQEKS